MKNLKLIFYTYLQSKIKYHDKTLTFYYNSLRITLLKKKWTFNSQAPYLNIAKLNYV